MAGLQGFQANNSLDGASKVLIRAPIDQLEPQQLAVIPLHQATSPFSSHFLVEVFA